MSKYDLEAHCQYGALTARLDKFCRFLEARQRANTIQATETL